MVYCYRKNGKIKLSCFRHFGLEIKAPEETVF